MTKYRVYPITPGLYKIQYKGLFLWHDYWYLNSKFKGWFETEYFGSVEQTQAKIEELILYESEKDKKDQYYKIWKRKNKPYEYP